MAYVHLSIALALSVFMAVPQLSLAHTPPPFESTEAITWKPTLKRVPAKGLRMGMLGIQFGSTTLHDVHRAVKSGEISHTGDAGNSIYWLCYSNLSASKAERIWIVAHGEMGGPERQVTSLTVAKVASGDLTRDCPALPNRLKPLSLDNQIWLGSTEGAVLAKLGPPSQARDGWRFYEFEGKAPAKCGDSGFDVVAWLHLRVEHGRIDALRVGKVTSC